MSPNELTPVEALPEAAGEPVELDRTGVSLFVATAARDPRVTHVIEHARTGHFATPIHLYQVSEQFLHDVVAVNPADREATVLLEEVVAGDTAALVQLVDPDEIDAELTTLERVTE